MNKLKHSKVNSYFDEKTAACKAEAKALELDERRDEAVFAKIRLNVYDIFRTVFSVAVNSAGGDDSKVAAFFLTKIDQIPGNWRTSLELARQHRNSEKAHLEQIKLDTTEQIRKSFERIWEVQS